MIAMPGVISDRLRKLFGADVANWPAYRKADVKPMPTRWLPGGGPMGGKPGRTAQR